MSDRTTPPGHAVDRSVGPPVHGTGRPPASVRAGGRGRRAAGARWGFALAGGVAAAVAAISHPDAARGAASQDWPPFVLVAGLLLVGLVAAGDGLFEAAGRRLARVAPGDTGALVALGMLVAATAAVLNLDTSAVFLTPVAVHAARSRRMEVATPLAACILLSNAGSLLLPGSNLTNLIVLGHLRLSGSAFAHRMALPWLAALLVTGAVVVGAARLRRRSPVAPDAPDVPEGERGEGDRPEDGAGHGGGRRRLGAAAITAVVVLLLVLRAPALPVAAVGVACAAVRLAGRQVSAGRVAHALGLPVLCGLLGVAVCLGTVGRVWSGPEVLLGHLDAAGVAAAAAVGSVLVNNLPAASLLAARVPPHPFALLVGLNLGPNLFPTGSLAWFLWARAARSAGAGAPYGRAVALGVIAAPLSIAAAVAVLAAGG